MLQTANWRITTSCTFHLQRLPPFVHAACARQHTAGVGVLLPRLDFSAEPAAASPQGVEESLQVVAIKVGPAKDQALLHVEGIQDTLQDAGLQALDSLRPVFGSVLVGAPDSVKCVHIIGGHLQRNSRGARHRMMISKSSKKFIRQYEENLQVES